MIKHKMMSLFTREIAVDLGSQNTRVALVGEGKMLCESSMVAVAGSDWHEIRAIGESAYEMLGRTPGGVKAVYPMQGGIVSDYGLVQEMLRFFFEKAIGKKTGMLGVRAVMSVPGSITKLEQQALEAAARGAGARDVRLINRSVAAAVGAGLPVGEAVGCMVVDIGSANTSAAVLALGGVAAVSEAKLGGKAMDDAIASYLQKQYGVSVGERRRS